MKLFASGTLWMLAFGFAGLVLTMKSFRGIVSGRMALLFWTFKRNGHERSFAIWMSCFALLSLVFYFAALRFYLGPFGF